MPTPAAVLKFAETLGKLNPKLGPIVIGLWKTLVLADFLLELMTNFQWFKKDF